MSTAMTISNDYVNQRDFRDSKHFFAVCSYMHCDFDTVESVHTTMADALYEKARLNNARPAGAPLKYSEVTVAKGKVGNDYPGGINNEADVRRYPSGMYDSTSHG